MKRKHKLTAKKSILVVVEGEREKAFLKFIVDLYKPTHKINIDNPKGGSSDVILDKAMRQIKKYEEIYAWFDEDIPLSNKIKEELLHNFWHIVDKKVNLPDKDLQNSCNSNFCNPVIIVSEPHCIDCVIMKLVNPSTLTHSTDSCKTQFHDVILKNKKRFDREREIKYYKKSITKDMLEKSNQSTISLLLKIVSPH